MIHDIAEEVHREYGRYNISVIAERAHCDRKTVRKYLEKKNIPVSIRKRETSTKLDSFKSYIRGRLSEYPLLSGRQIFRDIKDKGYMGSYPRVTAYLRDIRPLKKPLAVYRFETKPGIQAQVDWGNLGLIRIDGEDRHLYIFTMILGYSRMRFAMCTLSMDVETLIECHKEAFKYFGGVPKEILYDNMKTVVIKKCFNSKDCELNRSFTDFADYYGFTIRTCKPYRPQTKGKIENTVKYLKKDFFYGTEFTSFTDIESKLFLWMERVNHEVHGTTNEVPYERMKDEMKKLRKITDIVPYPVSIGYSRKVSRDSYVSYLGNWYSVPYYYADRNVTVKVTGGFMAVFCNGDEICQHEIQGGKKKRIRIKEHFKGLLPETMAENTKKSYSRRDILHFKGIEVENRPLEEYERLSLGGRK